MRFLGWLVLVGKLMKGKKISEEAVVGEIIRFTWWTSNVVHHSTKKLPII